MSLESELARYRRTFVATLPERGRAIEAAVGRATAGVVDARAELETLLHKVAGSAGIHGLAELSDAALALLRRVTSGEDLRRMADWEQLAELGLALDGALRRG